MQSICSPKPGVGHCRDVLAPEVLIYMHMRLGWSGPGELSCCSGHMLVTSADSNSRGRSMGRDAVGEDAPPYTFIHFLKFVAPILLLEGKTFYPSTQMSIASVLKIIPSLQKTVLFTEEMRLVFAKHVIQ